MSWTIKIIPDADAYERALDAGTRRLLTADLQKLARNPYDPPGLSSRPYQGQRDLRTVSCARGKLLVQYRVYRDLVEIHVIKILP